jgi:hypothetical protein
LADIIERQVLRDWRAAKARLQALRHVPHEQTTLVTKLIQYMEIREQAWQLWVDAIRKQDKSLVAAAQAKSAEADRTARSLRD